MAMKLTASIFCLLFVAVVTEIPDLDAYNECNEEFQKVFDTIAPENQTEFAAKYYDCLLRVIQLITSDNKFDYEKVKEILSLALHNLRDNDENSVPTKEFVNNMVEECKAKSEGGTNSEIFYKMQSCLLLGLGYTNRPLTLLK